MNTPAQPMRRKIDMREPASPTMWAKCCTRLYHGSMNRAHWDTCFDCKKPLVYHDTIPTSQAPTVHTAQ